MQDLLPSAVSEFATFIAARTSLAEKDGTFVNHAGLAQAIHWAVTPTGECRTDGQVFLDLLERRGLVHAPTLRKELAGEIRCSLPWPEESWANMASPWRWGSEVCFSRRSRLRVCFSRRSRLRVRQRVSGASRERRNAKPQAADGDNRVFSMNCAFNEFTFWITLILIAAVMGAVQGTCAYLILAERKISAWAQDRIGPNRVGPLGLLQPIADGIKFLLKEEVIPDHVDKLFYFLGPAIAVSTALMAIAVVPFGKTTTPPVLLDRRPENPAKAAFSETPRAPSGRQRRARRPPYWPPIVPGRRRTARRRSRSS